MSLFYGCPLADVKNEVFKIANGFSVLQEKIPDFRKVLANLLVNSMLCGWCFSGAFIFLLSSEAK